MHHNAEQGMFMPLDTESTPSTAYLIMAGIAIAIIILAIVIFSQKRKGISKNKVKNSIFKCVGGVYLRFLSFLTKTSTNPDQNSSSPPIMNMNGNMMLTNSAGSET